MDIARPELRNQRIRRQVIWSAVGVIAITSITIGVSQLKPAIPEVDRKALWTDTVKRGPLLRQVHGLGSLVASQEFERQIPAETDATVIRIFKLPGSYLHADTVIAELSNAELEQAAFDAKLQLNVAKAEYQTVRAKLESDLTNQKANRATIASDYDQAELQAEADKVLYQLGVIAGIKYRISKAKADELATRKNLENERLDMNTRATRSQLAEQEAKINQMQALADVKQHEVNSLKVRAGIEGVLVELPLRIGQHVTPGTMLAKVIQPNHLMAALTIAETQARDLQIGQSASIDTHNGTISGVVSRVDPVVQNGMVAVDVELTGDLPKGARPDLSVDGTIDLERLEDVLYVGRPAFSQENGAISLFKVDGDQREAVRVGVKFGHTSANTIQILSGLNKGDVVILSDMSRYDGADRLRLQ